MPVGAAWLVITDLAIPGGPLHEGPRSALPAGTDHGGWVWGYRRRSLEDRQSRHCATVGEAWDLSPTPAGCTIDYRIKARTEAAASADYTAAVALHRRVLDGELASVVTAQYDAAAGKETALNEGVGWSASGDGVSVEMLFDRPAGPAKLVLGLGGLDFWDSKLKRVRGATDGTPFELKPRGDRLRGTVGEHEVTLDIDHDAEVVTGTVGRHELRRRRNDVHATRIGPARLLSAGTDPTGALAVWRYDTIGELSPSELVLLARVSDQWRIRIRRKGRRAVQADRDGP